LVSISYNGYKFGAELNILNTTVSSNLQSMSYSNTQPNNPIQSPKYLNSDSFESKHVFRINSVSFVSHSLLLQRALTYFIDHHFRCITPPWNTVH